MPPVIEPTAPLPVAALQVGSGTAQSGESPMAEPQSASRRRAWIAFGLNGVVVWLVGLTSKLLVLFTSIAVPAPMALVTVMS